MKFNLQRSSLSAGRWWLRILSSIEEINMDFELRIINNNVNTDRKREWVSEKERKSLNCFYSVSSFRKSLNSPHQNPEWTHAAGWNRPHYRAIHFQVVTRATMIEGVVRVGAQGCNIHSFHLTPLSSLLFRSVIPSHCTFCLRISSPSSSLTLQQNLPTIQYLFSYHKTQNYPNIHASNIVTLKYFLSDDIFSSTTNGDGESDDGDFWRQIRQKLEWMTAKTKD